MTTQDQSETQMEQPEVQVPEVQDQTEVQVTEVQVTEVQVTEVQVTEVQDQTEVQVTEVQDQSQAPLSFKALPMMRSFANLLQQRADKFMTLLTAETRKKRKSTVMCEYSLPSGSQNITDMYFAGTTENGDLIEPTQANGGFPIVLLVMGPKRSRSDSVKITALSLCNEALKTAGASYFLTSSKGRIYINW
jgi:hypothetical protein